MSGNSFGKLFTVTTAGESHGAAYVAIVDGCPPNLELTEEDIQKELDRRKPGQSKYTTQRRESDRVQILSGVFEGKTTGTPIALLIENEDHRSRDYEEIKNKFRPGHADYTYHHKYGIRDYRGGGRASARETMMRVAAGAIAKKYLTEHLSIEIIGYVAQIGEVTCDFIDETIINDNPFFCADPEKINTLEEYVHGVRRQGDSVGARINIIARNTPVGLGEPIFDRLDADIAKAMMCINAVKAVEIGDGFKVVAQNGSAHRDEITSKGFSSNHSGGVLGGISSGQDILVSMAFKPTSSIMKPGHTVDTKNDETEIKTKGRHDPCVGIRAVPIAESMLALTLLDHLLRFKAQCG